MIATQPLSAPDAWTRSARAALASYDAALDAVHHAVLRVSARPVQPEQHLPESMARALIEKAEVIQAGMRAARADVVNMHAHALPLSVMATLMCTGVVRVVRLRINLGGEDLPVWETITVTAPQWVHESPYIVSCTSERTPEFWADQTAGSCDDPLGMYMPRCARQTSPSAFTHATRSYFWPVKTTRRTKRTAGGTENRVYTYTCTIDRESTAVVFEAMARSSEFTAEMCRTASGPPMLTAHSAGDGAVRFK
jgi:hypothetical protein